VIIEIGKAKYGPVFSKKLQTPISGKFNDTVSADIVIIYLSITLQNRKKSKKYCCKIFIYKLNKGTLHSFIYQ